jgi:hypothetical protein
MLWNAAPSAFDGVLGGMMYLVVSLSSSTFSMSSSRDTARTASASSFHVIGFNPTSFRSGLGSFFRVEATSRLFVSGMSPASLSTLSAHTTCDSSSSAPTLAATLFPRSPAFSTVSSSRVCFSAVVFSVMALTGHRSSKASRAVVNDALFALVRVTNHAAAGDFALRDSSRKRTFSSSESPVFIRMILSSRFIKSWGSWSSGFPVNDRLDMSAMFGLSLLRVGGGKIGGGKIGGGKVEMRKVGGGTIGGVGGGKVERGTVGGVVGEMGRVFPPLSCGVHVAGENV